MSASTFREHHHIPCNLCEEQLAAVTRERDELKQDRDEWRAATIDANKRFKSAEKERDELKDKLARYEDWPALCEGDRPLPEDEAIKAAMPTRRDTVPADAHTTWAIAMYLVSAKRSKFALVALVNWLLVRIAELEVGK